MSIRTSKTNEYCKIQVVNNIHRKLQFLRVHSMKTNLLYLCQLKISYIITLGTRHGHDAVLRHALVEQKMSDSLTFSLPIPPCLSLPIPPCLSLPIPPCLSLPLSLCPSPPSLLVSFPYHHFFFLFFYLSVPSLPLSIPSPTLSLLPSSPSLYLSNNNNVGFIINNSKTDSLFALHSFLYPTFKVVPRFHRFP